MRRTLLLLLVGCAGAPPTGPDTGPEADAGLPIDAGTQPFDGGTGEDGHGLPAVHAVDAAAAARGEALLLNAQLGGGLVPLLAMRNLWLVWGGAPPGSDALYWAAFRERYGLIDGGPAGLPLGLHVTASNEVALDCLTCHAAVLNGVRVIGAPNVRFDLQGLFDDLVRLSQIAPMFGYPATPPPFVISGRTQAAGANDAMGLGLELAARAAPGVSLNTRQGFQRPPAWWTLKHKGWHYVDGSGPAGGYRLMMATLLAGRSTLAELQAQDAQFADLEQYLLSLQAPAWPFAVPNAAKVAEGRAVFEGACASCHGKYDGTGRTYPNAVSTTVGTDATRASAFTVTEVTAVNASWFGANGAMRATGGYLAADLTGVWATAPYLHNGSVPTLEALLDSSKRPARFRLGATYDPAAVGWQFTVESMPSGQASIAARRVYDTGAAGLSNAGHTFGDALTAAQREAVLEYLKTL